MIKFLVIFLGSFFVAFAFAPVVIGFLYGHAIRRQGKEELDKKIEEHARKTGTPVMGGLIIILAALVVNLLVNRSAPVPGLLVVLILGSVLGAVDDLFNVFGHERVSEAVRRGITPVVTVSGFTWSIYKVILLPWHAFKEAFRVMGSYRGGFKAHEKFLLQCLLAGGTAFYVYNYLGRSSLWLPLLGPFNLGIFYPFLVTFVMVAFANAFSITDGLDGLSGGTHATAFLALGVIAIALGEISLAFFSASLAGTELAFLYFNIYPARVEMSDVGTLPLGMIFALLGVLLNRIVILPVIGLIFFVEILSSFIQVWSVKLRGKRIFRIAPIHHHFEALGWPETKVTMRFWLVSSLAAVLGILIALL